MTSTVFSAMKNEAPFLLEWVAYYKAIGFDRIAIFSNDSDDGTTELLDALAAAGQIEHRLLSVPPGIGPQANAARVLNTSGLLRQGDWFMWVDADEFLNIHVGDGTLSALIEFMGDHQGLLLQWRIFGDGGNARFPGRFISADFTGASEKSLPDNAEIKTLFRVTDRVRGFGELGFSRPVLHPLPDNRGELFLNCRGGTIQPQFAPHARWLAGDDFARSRLSAPRDMGWRIAQLNHYSVRTPEHFALKKSRGRGWASPEGKSPVRHNATLYRTLNRNDQRDATILRFKDRVTEGIERLRAIPDVAKAEFEALGITRQRIAGMLSQTRDERLPADAAP